MAFAVCISSLHLLMLNSRVATSSLSLASIVCLTVLATITFVSWKENRDEPQPLAFERTAALCCAAAYTIASIIFAISYLPPLRAICFAAIVASASGLVLCEAARLSQLDKHTFAMTLTASATIGALALLVIAGVGALAGFRANMANYTLFCIAANIILIGIWAYAFRIQRQSPENPCSCFPDDDFVDGDSIEGDPIDNAPTNANSVSEESDNEIDPEYMRFDPSSLALFATVCVASMGATFFDGFSFNPFVRDVVSMDLARFAIDAAAGMAALAVIARLGAMRFNRTMTAIVTLILCLCITGIVALSIGITGSETVGTVIVCASHDLLLLAGLGMAFLVIPFRPKVTCAMASCVVLFCGGAPLMALGIGSKHSIGYSLSTVTPMVVGVIALLAIASLATSAHMSGRMRDLRESHAVELTQQKRDLTTRRERDLSEERRSTALTAAIGEVPLSKREKEAALHAMLGITNKEIAMRMGISEKTVAFHLSNFYHKTGIDGKTTLVSIGYDEEDEDQP
ncbi:MAG: LuxR family transcriptional regulator [Eggerthellaceae bacterium]|nr:LuxR family transcriptional regulator [Eggerthellaceae bacterium]